MLGANKKRPRDMTKIVLSFRADVTEYIHIFIRPANKNTLLHQYIRLNDNNAIRGIYLDRGICILWICKINKHVFETH